MKAYVFSEKGIIEKKELPDAVLDESRGEDELAAILKPVYLSPCSSDVHTVFAGAGPRRENLVLGHEGIAEVLEVGSVCRSLVRILPCRCFWRQSLIMYQTLCV